MHMRLNKQQQIALKRVYDLAPNGEGPFSDALSGPERRKSYLQFRRTVLPMLGGDGIMVFWADMWLGIERDGYIHT